MQTAACPPRHRKPKSGRRGAPAAQGHAPRGGAWSRGLRGTRIPRSTSGSVPTSQAGAPGSWAGRSPTPHITTPPRKSLCVACRPRVGVRSLEATSPCGPGRDLPLVISDGLQGLAGGGGCFVDEPTWAQRPGLLTLPPSPWIGVQRVQAPGTEVPVPRSSPE